MSETSRESRLNRAMHAELRTHAALVKFMRKHAIPHVTDFRSRTLPDAELRRLFDHTYGLTPFPEINLEKKGASTILVFEYRNIKGYNHGEVTSTIAQRVGESLQPQVNTIYVDMPINLRFLPELDEGVKNSTKLLFQKQGVPVINTSVGWEDSYLSFQQKMDQEGFRQMTAFVVDSAGNDGRKDYWGNPEPGQKHNGASHFPPLIVHVGAAAKDNYGVWNIEGYSSANCPTLLAPVASSHKIKWGDTREAEEISGTSAAAPYMSGVLAGLNTRYGAYLTREQILYALIATATPVETVKKFGEKTREDTMISYAKNAAGLRFNPEYGGFGLVHHQRADRLLAQMVQLTQADPGRISTPIESTAEFKSDASTPPKKDADGKYTYTLEMPAGLALKTTLAAEFASDHDPKKPHGCVTVISPSGVEFPMVFSRLSVPVKGTDGVNYWPFSKTDVFGLSTSHAWAGEPLGGKWTIRSTTPIKQLQMSQHHFMEKDIVKDLDARELCQLPIPDLSAAIPIRDMKGRWVERTSKTYEKPSPPLQVPEDHRAAILQQAQSQTMAK